MKLSCKLNQTSRAPKLAHWRIVLALAVAVIADGLQFFSGFFGWIGFDQAVDCVAMVLAIWLLGFHILFLPTFVAELIPLLDDLPTWTACVIAVIALRKREQRNSIPSPPLPNDKPPIDI